MTTEAQRIAGMRGKTIKEVVRTPYKVVVKMEGTQLIITPFNDSPHDTLVVKVRKEYKNGR